MSLEDCLSTDVVMSDSAKFLLPAASLTPIFPLIISEGNLFAENSNGSTYKAA